MSLGNILFDRNLLKKIEEFLNTHDSKKYSLGSS